MNSRTKNILDEQLFPYIGMSIEERNYYLNIIKNCKDICDTENKVDNISKCEIVEMRLKKQGNVVSLNGSLTIGTDNIRENRCIEGYIYIEKNSIIVDYKVTRLFIDKEPKIYTVLDEFELKNGKLKRRSQYNYNMKSIYSEVDNELMKGKIK